MSEKIIFKTYDSEVKTVDEERALNVTITTQDKDRSGDIVVPRGAKLANFRKNPVVLLAHDYRGLPIAKAEKLERSDNNIQAKVVFPEEGTYPLADTVYNLYKNKFMKAWSIGFIPLKSEDIYEEDDEENKEDEIRRTTGRRFKTWELLEFSACSVPANPNALSNMMEKGIDLDPLKEIGLIEIEESDVSDNTVTKPEENEKEIRLPVRECEITATIDISKDEGIRALYCGKIKKVATYIFLKAKGWTMEKARKWVKDHGETVLESEEEIEAKKVIPFKETPKASESEDWDAAKEVREAEISDLKIICTWYDSENPDIKGSYKLPHHKAKGHVVVWRAVAAAMAALLGARGGVAIPGSDKKGVYNHLVKHYKQFDKEPPEFRDYEPEELRELFPDDFDGVKKSYNVEEIYEIVKENKELKEKVKEIELKVGAVLNKKNKQNLKDAQNLIQQVLDTAETTEEDSQNNDEDNEKDIELIEEDDNTGDGDVKDEVTDEDDIEIDDELISEVVNEKIDYLLGKVKKQSNANDNKEKGCEK
jgi:hypothetical protein